MCLAIVNPSSQIPFETFRTADKSNPDGMGMLYIEKGRLQVHKEIKDVSSFYRFYSSLREGGNNKPILIHFRWSTHGTKDIDNCHPFMIRHDLGFIHNGVITAATKHNTKSDTAMFCEEILSKLPKTFLRSPAVLRLIEEYVGTSKLCFLNSAGKYTIIREAMGDWVNGDWYSNDTGFKLRAYEYSTPNGAWVNGEFLPSARSVVIAAGGVTRSTEIKLTAGDSDFLDKLGMKIGDRFGIPIKMDMNDKFHVIKGADALNWTKDEPELLHIKSGSIYAWVGGTKKWYYMGTVYDNGYTMTQFGYAELPDGPSHVQLDELFSAEEGDYGDTLLELHGEEIVPVKNVVTQKLLGHA